MRIRKIIIIPGKHQESLNFFEGCLPKIADQRTPEGSSEMQVLDRKLSASVFNRSFPRLRKK
jgi:hypothetical protein